MTISHAILHACLVLLLDKSTSLESLLPGCVMLAVISYAALHSCGAQQYYKFDYYDENRNKFLCVSSFHSGCHKINSRHGL